MARIAEQAGPVTGGWAPTPMCRWPRWWIRWAGCWAPRPSRPRRPGTRAAVAGMSWHGELARAGVEGTGRYGAGLARYLAGCGVEVVEVIRPNRQARRQRGKPDAAGAVAAALAVLSGQASGMAKSRDGAAESRPGAAGGPGRRGQGPHPGRPPAARPDPHRARAGAPAASRVAVPAAGGGGGPVPPAGPGRPCRGRQGGDGQRGPPPPAADGRDRPAGCRARGTRHPRRPETVPGQAGRGQEGRRHAAGHHRRQPRPGPQRRQLRRPVRCQPGGCLRRQAGPPPAQPRRRPGRPTPRYGRSP